MNDALPVMNAAGMIKTAGEAATYYGLPVQAIMLGSYTLEERVGNPGCTYYYQSRRGSVNSVGLPSPKMDDWAKIVEQVKTESGMEVRVSVAGFSPEEFGVMTEAAFAAGSDRVELNMGCPNVISDGVRKPIPSYNPDLLGEGIAAGVEAARKFDKKVDVKLSPILDSLLMVRVAGVLNSFAAFIGAAVSMNTVPNALAVDRNGLSVIGSPDGRAGMAGEAVKWLALGQVAQLGELLTDEIGLVGVGGIQTGTDMRDMLMLPKVESVQAGTAVAERGPDALVRLCVEYAQFLDAS